MTELQHYLIECMITGDYYLMNRKSHSGRDGYMLYSGNMNPHHWFSQTTVKCIKGILKKDVKHRLTLNLSKVRQLHGKTLLKKLYKKSNNTINGTKCCNNN